MQVRAGQTVDVIVVTFLAAGPPETIRERGGHSVLRYPETRSSAGNCPTARSGSNILAPRR